MDPVSAAGIGLSAASLALQLFAGCVTAYELFVKMEDMPVAYQHLRLRLRWEQMRLVNWGERSGFDEELLDQPSRVLQLNRNLIFDMLLEIQTLFRNAVKIKDIYDRLVPDKPSDVGTTPPSAYDVFLNKTLKVFKRLPQAPQRLYWAIIKEEEFTNLIKKLIGCNNSIEGILESSVMDELLRLQRQTSMRILQLDNSVEGLRKITQAMELKTETPLSSNLNDANHLRLMEAGRQNLKNLADLAEFKAQLTMIESNTGYNMPLSILDIVFRDDMQLQSRRDEALFQGCEVWIEWKDITPENDRPQWTSIINRRVKNLVTLLQLPAKSPHFRTPDCLGYFNSPRGELQRYGFVFAKPPGVPGSTKPIALLDHIIYQPRPSLTIRIALSHALAVSLMYLHAVNWLHKGLRSSNIVFFNPAGIVPSYNSPIICGFDYARLDLTDEHTDPVPEHSEHDVYRHPETLGHVHIRSKKSHDIYSLGIIMLEIAHWQRIEQILKLSKNGNAARKALKKNSQFSTGPAPCCRVRRSRG